MDKKTIQVTPTEIRKAVSAGANVVRMYEAKGNRTYETTKGSPFVFIESSDRFLGYKAVFGDRCILACTMDTVKHMSTDEMLGMIQLMSLV